MKLFRRNSGPGVAAAATPPPLPPAPSQEPRAIPLSADQKRLLEKPVDPRVDRILQEIYADRVAAEAALKTRRIIVFPSADSGERHVVQGDDGFWRIVPGPAPTALSEFFDAL